uniref:BTB/POZ domain-containing protein 2 n=1 Tax=Anoplophora glabripennis TaxID=217634 RepID=V5I973_ANOGL
MVLKVEKSCEETKPILSFNDSDAKSEPDLKIGDAYRHITKSMRDDPLKIEKPELVLELFSTAIKMQDIPLAKECTEILNSQLDKNNALLVLRHIYKSEMMMPPPPDPLDLKPSAPPLHEDDNDFKEDWVQDLRDNLRNNCLLEIDKNADYVLKQKEVLELSYRDVLAITTRDTLQVSNEMLVYSVAMRWTMEECKRLAMDPQQNNMKAIARELVHAPRYGLLSKKEFCCGTVDGVKGPRRSGILEEREVEAILNYIKKKAKNRPLEGLPHKGSLPRRTGNEKSNAFHSGVSGDSVCSAASSCDKFVINFLTCWTVIFD